MFSSSSDAAQKSTISFYTGTPASPTSRGFIQLYKEGSGVQLLIDATGTSTDFRIQSGALLRLTHGSGSYVQIDSFGGDETLKIGDDAMLQDHDVSHSLVVVSQTDSSIGKLLFGSTNVVGVGTTSTNYLELWANTGAGGDIASHGTFRPSDDNTYSLGTDTYEWTEVWSYDTSVNHSDGRDKVDVASTRAGIEFIRRLSPREWKWDGKTRKHHGFIAQEVESTMIDLGIDSKDFAGLVIDSHGKYHLRYSEFIAPIVSALQNIDTRLSRMEVKNNG
jgi:hypothetical protein